MLLAGLLALGAAGFGHVGGRSAAALHGALHQLLEFRLALCVVGGHAGDHRRVLVIQAPFVAQVLHRAFDGVRRAPVPHFAGQALRQLRRILAHRVYRDDAAEVVDRQLDGGLLHVQRHVGARRGIADGAARYRQHQSRRHRALEPAVLFPRRERDGLRAQLDRLADRAADAAVQKRAVLTEHRGLVAAPLQYDRFHVDPS